MFNFGLMDLRLVVLCDGWFNFVVDVMVVGVKEVLVGVKVYDMVEVGIVDLYLIFVIIVCMCEMLKLVMNFCDVVMIMCIELDKGN